jgi:hypothetical protein
VPIAPLAPSASLPLKVGARAKPETISGLETHPMDDDRMAGIGKQNGSCRPNIDHSSVRGDYRKRTARINTKSSVGTQRYFAA